MSHNAESIRQAAQKHCEEVILPQVEAWESSTEYPREAAARAAGDGLLGLYCPAEYGGQGLSFAEGIPVYEEIGRTSGSPVGRSSASWNAGAIAR